jgi:hypothetical protein
MAGAGSGRPKTRERRFVDDCECLDINEIVKYGFIIYPAFALIESEPGPKYFSIRLIHDSNQRLVSTNQIIQLITTCPYLGGNRYWFKCLKCGLIVRMLYKHIGTMKFKCRQCHDLMYQSQETHVYDGWLKKSKTLFHKVYVSRHE